MALLIGAKPATAASACWKQVVEDWYDDGEINGVYPRHCYTDALKNVSEEVIVYTDFEEKAKAALLRVTRANNRSLSASGGSGSSTQREQSTPRPGSANEKPNAGLFKAAFDKSSPRNADSMPVPLLILGGLALLMIAAGAAGLLRRRLSNRRPAAP